MAEMAQMVGFFFGSSAFVTDAFRPLFTGFLLCSFSSFGRWLTSLSPPLVPCSCTSASRSSQSPPTLHCGPSSSHHLASQSQSAELPLLLPRHRHVPRRCRPRRRSSPGSSSNNATSTTIPATTLAIHPIVHPHATLVYRARIGSLDQTHLTHRAPTHLPSRRGLVPPFRRPRRRRGPA